MCGLAGFLDPVDHADPETWERRLAAMAREIRRRGPDSHGVWQDRKAGIGLAHVRLAIIDLSPAGAQPMLDEGGGLVLVFNGEIYNHLDLRDALGREGRAPAWRGRSDTETLLAAFAAWGVEETLRRSVGMFAFALWDIAKRSLALGRDRLGEKPLYYGWTGAPGRSTFLFASEIKAMRVHPAFDPMIDTGGIGLLLRDGYVSGPGSIHARVRRLPPGAYLSLSVADPDPAPRPYWSAAAEIAAARGEMFDAADPASAIDALETTLGDAVEGQLLSDAPLGAFLSGGVDSSTVVALMKARARGPVRSFAIGFDDPAYDEAPHAKAVADHLGLTHEELTVTGADALAVVPDLAAIYDEPFADASQIPTVLLSRMARARVTVALSGDGGDELFGGYDRYASAARLWNRLSATPRPVRMLAARMLAAAPGRALDALWQQGGDGQSLGQKVARLAQLADATDVVAFHRRFCALWPDAGEAVIGADPGDGPAQPPELAAAAMDPAERMMAIDALDYLPDDLLAKVDRAAMWASLETRAPLLDHRVAALAWRMPLGLKRRQGRTKWVLREVLYRHVPKAIVDRPKMGFSPPLHQWLRGPLRDWAEALLSPQRLAQEGYLRPEPVRRLWREHLDGVRDWRRRLWHVLMFQAWLEAQRSGAG
jgi:asparagine synthase (glutamine-hydrolysing)